MTRTAISSSQSDVHRLRHRHAASQPASLHGAVAASVSAAQQRRQTSARLAALTERLKAEVQSLKATLEMTAMLCRTERMGLWQHILPLRPGDVLEIHTGEPTALSDVRAWCELTGNELVGAEVRDSGTRLLIRKARPRPARTVAGGSAELPGRAAR